MKLIDKKTSDFILEYESRDVNELALREGLFKDIDIHYALKQIKARQIAKHKIPTWYAFKDIIYPRHLSLEQSSSEVTAKYKADLLNSGTFIDLTGGLGVDFFFMAQSMLMSTYLETQKELAELAEYNFDILSLTNYQINETNSVDYLKSTDNCFDTIYIDPARRNETGRKTVFIEDCTPNLLEIEELLESKGKRTIIKLSPMLDINHALHSIKNISQVHIVSVANECKELLLIKEKTDKDTEIYCVNLLNNNDKDIFKFTYIEEESVRAKYSDSVLRYLYEPNSSIMKSGGYNCLSERYFLKKLHANSHLYTSDLYIDNFPGRKFIVKQIISPNKREIKQSLKDITKANITTRNYPISAEEIKKQTKLKDGGNFYIFATTLLNEKKILILCEKAKNSLL